MVSNYYLFGMGKKQKRQACPGRDTRTGQKIYQQSAKCAASPVHSDGINPPPHKRLFCGGKKSEIVLVFSGHFYDWKSFSLGVIFLLQRFKKNGDHDKEQG